DQDMPYIALPNVIPHLFAELTFATMDKQLLKRANTPAMSTPRSKLPKVNFYPIRVARCLVQKPCHDRRYKCERESRCKQVKYAFDPARYSHDAPPGPCRSKLKRAGERGTSRPEMQRAISNTPRFWLG